MTTLRIGFDPGSSLTKAIYSIDKQRPQLLTMASEVIALGDEMFQQKADTIRAGVLTGTNDAHLKYKKSADRVYSVGQLAREFDGEIDLEQNKHEYAVPRFLAVIGAIVERERINREGIRVQLTAVLPYDEYASEEIFREQIAKRGRTYYFRGQKIKLEIDEPTVLPEGGGFVMELADKHGDDWLASQENVGVLMIGHRNASYLNFRHGRLNRELTQTTDLGFVRLVDIAAENSAGQNRERLTRSIYELGNEIEADNPIVRSLVRTKEAENIRVESQQLASAISQARVEYWHRLKNWIDSAIPGRKQSLTIAGGGAFYMRPELSTYLANSEPVWAEIPANDPLIANESDPSLKYRIGDIYAATRQMFGTIWQQAA